MSEEKQENITGFDYLGLERVVLDPVEIPTTSDVEKKSWLRKSPQRKKPKVAVFTTHGMGQQLPFQTLDAVAKGLIKTAAERHKDAVQDPKLPIQAQTVKIGDQTVSRLVFDMTDANGKEVEVHIYESYWAYFTEGQVNLRDVLSFLYAAAFNGFLNGLRQFKRWIFGRSVPFKITGKTPKNLLLAALVLSSLIFMNALAGLVWAGRFAAPGAGSQTHSWPDDSLFTLLTWELGVFVTITTALFLCFYFVMKWKGYVKTPAHNALWRSANNILNGLVWSWYFFTILVGLAMGVAVVWGSFWGSSFKNVVSVANPTSLKALVVVWGLLLGVSWMVRHLLIQYMGDVAAYVRPHYLSRFADVRRSIKQAVIGVLRGIYQAKDSDGTPLYERVGIIAHSLGSVISYDALNFLLNADYLTGEPLQVRARTRVFLTFGSPLDKTAYIFGLQGSETSDTREALAASRQPLILKYQPFREHLTWINVYSKRDIISGSLDFYDDSNVCPNEKYLVKNTVDPDALIPLAAHTEYWENSTIWKKFYEAL